MTDECKQLNQVYQLLVRLEHLSADSFWAHRASGLRGSLLRCVEQIETDRGNHQKIDEETWKKVNSLVTGGFLILESAAREIRAQENNPG